MSGLDRRFDAIVIGSGAAGSIAVKELTERGMEVLLLEAGRDLTEADFVPPPPKRPKPVGLDFGPRARAALRGQHVQGRRPFFNPSTSRFLVNDRENPYTTPRGRPYVWIRGRLLGGRLNSYGRLLLRMSDYDFKAASRDGHGADWPLAYAELAPWYDRVEEFLGVYGNADGLAHPPDGRYVGPSKLTEVELDFKRRVEQQWPERRVIAWRYAAPNLGRVPLGIAAARATGRLTTRTDAVVQRVTVDRNGRADGAVFVDRVTKREHRVSADVVVLCASTIETVRLLLHSGSGRHPDGLANASGLVGRYFMDQTISLALGSIPDRPGFYEPDESAPPDPFYSAAGGFFIPRFHNLDGPQESAFVRGIGFQGLAGRFPVPEGGPTSIGFGGMGEMLARHDNRVTLDPRRRDAWGIPAPRIDLSLGENDVALLREQVRVLREITGHLGYRMNFVGSTLGLDSKQVFPDVDPLSRFVFRRGFRRSLALGAAIHECGGARMGADPASSVVNAYNQAWDVPNLFVTDASCFVTNGTVGPTLTIMALTARACEHIAREHAVGALHKEATRA